MARPPVKVTGPFATGSNGISDWLLHTVHTVYSTRAGIRAVAEPETYATRVTVQITDGTAGRTGPVRVPAASSLMLASGDDHTSSTY